VAAKRYTVRRTIKAPAERVWSLLADPDRYSLWNPSVLSLRGQIADEGKLTLIAAVSPKRSFSLTVSDVEPGRGMVWSEGMPLGLFRGVRTFSLRPTGDGDTEFSMQEIYSGPLAGLITMGIPDLTKSFAQFADGLKRAAEETEA
jgi:hypothetical protein